MNKPLENSEISGTSLAILIRVLNAFLSIAFIAIASNHFNKDSFSNFIFIQSTYYLFTAILGAALTNFIWQKINLGMSVSESLHKIRISGLILTFLGVLTVCVIFLNEINFLKAFLYSLALYIFIEVNIDEGVLKGIKKFIVSDFIALIYYKVISVILLFLFISNEASFDEIFLWQFFSVLITSITMKAYRLFQTKNFDFINISFDYKYFLELFGFIKMHTSSGLTQRSPIIVLNLIGRKDEAAVFSLFQNIFQSSLIISTTIFSRMRWKISDFIKNSEKELLQILVTKNVRIAFLLDCLLALFILFTAPYLIENFFGEYLHNVNDYLLFVLIIMFTRSICGPANAIFICFNKQEWLANVLTTHAFIFVPFIYIASYIYGILGSILCFVFFFIFIETFIARNLYLKHRIISSVR